MSSSIPSWQILTVHAQLFREARNLAFCLKVPLDSLLVWASSGGSGETARMRWLAWTFAARIGDKYQIHLTRSSYPLIITKYPPYLFHWFKHCAFEDVSKKCRQDCKLCRPWSDCSGALLPRTVLSQYLGSKQRLPVWVTSLQNLSSGFVIS